MPRMVHIVDPGDPRHDRAVAKAQDQLAVERDAAALAFDDADKMRIAARAAA